jgi:hypothetical protein
MMEHPAESRTLSTYSCSADSLQLGEALYGTASTAAAWFLLEYNGSWEAKAFQESDVPGAVKEHLQLSVPGAAPPKLQLIRRPPGRREAGIRFFVALAAETAPALYEFHLDRYEDLLDLNLQGILAGEVSLGSRRRVDPLILVCTNGRRDPCCARHGLPFYAKMLKIAGMFTWQTTHLGGHRFAANAVCFPHGVYYGRLGPEDAGDLVGACRRGEILIERYRGRACYPQVVQAAEYFLRKRSGVLGLEAYRLVESRPLAPGHWWVQFIASQSGDRYTLRLEVEATGVQFFASCRQDKLSELMRYHLREYSDTDL